MLTRAQTEFLSDERLLTSTQKGLIYLAETIVLVFFILAFGDAFVRKLVKIPARLRDKIHVVKILHEIKEEISHYLFTVACINAGLGVATAVAMRLLGMPNAILWGVMAATFNFVPYLGSAVTLTVLTVVALITFDTLAHAAMVPVVFLTLATIEGQIVNPIIVGRRMSLSPLVIVIALMIGAWVWGIVGVLLAVPLLVIDAWEHAWYLQYLNEKTKFFDAIWNVINWKDVAQRFEQAHGSSLVLEQVAERAA